VHNRGAVYLAAELPWFTLLIGVSQPRWRTDCPRLGLCGK